MVAVAGKPKNILIVDDEPDILEALSLTWSYEAPGLRVRTAYSGPRALAAIEIEKPDLILTDYKMPEMDGIEFVKRVHEKYPEIPCIMMTAYPDPGLAQRAHDDAGMKMFVAKPFNIENLIAGIQAIFLKPTQASRT